MQERSICITLLHTNNNTLLFTFSEMIDVSELSANILFKTKKSENNDKRINSLFNFYRSDHTSFSEYMCS